eukprot:CAMPEP_0194199618 /NCGR_PEP_ID=MMETSP0156-20130528/573_1 /TAXON_ID=33649 /ORGANISM="Thalassionema nitzschioides, Strain L26-B" /LENGTH=233 /DNA_ID=CAMNT_0038924541 /DNA_START=66 /DNA_END=767 /DNA_ORIENTATION=-
MFKRNKYTWECSCGKIKANLKGEPLAQFNCHCHSCVAASEFIDNKQLGGLSCRNSTGGAAVMMYPSNRVEFTTDLSENGESLLQFITVDEKGVPYRCYTKCCGSQMNNAIFPQLIAFNANGVLNLDGNKHDRGDVTNIRASFAFDEEKVPERKHKTDPAGVLFGLIIRLMNPFHPKKFDKRYKELFPDKSETETVPITWEGDQSSATKKDENAPESPIEDMNNSDSSGMSHDC